jgi:uncharacterized protein (TIGR02118 family)
MVTITIAYPNAAGSRFDMEYYLGTHMPMSARLLSAHPEFRSCTIERGLSGAEPGSRPPFAALCHFVFDSVDGFMAAFTPHAGHLQGDIPNYTDIVPVIQVSDVGFQRS